jgi:hypothetical protein
LFTNLPGTVVAVHRFKPYEYLSPPHATALMAPDAPVHAKVKIADSGEEAMAFEFAFTDREY